MRKKLVLAVIAILVIAVLFVAFYGVAVLNLAQEKDTLYQVSPFNVFSAGNFEGSVTYGELEKRGNFGIGTLDDLDGEMIALDGAFYQIPVSGIPRKIDISETTPYATVTFFNGYQTFAVMNISSYSQLAANINSTLPNYSSIYSIKVHGFFDFAKTRSVPAQTKPYPTLTEVVKNQTIFNLNEVEGTAVGFFFPESMNGIDSVGYHLHFLSDNHTAGGHLLECAMKNATVEIGTINNYHLLIP